ncbi:MAG TPA: hypothetical protein DEG76_16880 [Pseudohongiella sp.]|nr:hypothetical protein [Pseudohongiella sp.]HBX38852.1 hypothetical protein [Pseudohongiella sp.]|tara:strand:+ start:22641 stop:23492 length:852 start_codon:yes stop_codon:yes gene_type:complete
MSKRSGTRLRVPFLLLFASLLVACAATPQSQQLLSSPPDQLPEGVELVDVPFFPQELYQCGPAALATILQYNEVAVQPDDLVSHVYIPSRQGSLQVEMLAATRTFERVPYVIPGTLTAIINELEAGNPVLVFQNLGLSVLPQWHYAVVVGFDPEQQELILRSGTIREYRVALPVFERTWQRAEHWAFVALTPGDLPASAEVSDYFMAVADFQRLHPELSGAAWQAGYQQWPDQAVIAMGYSNWLYQQGDLARAASVLEQLLSIQPDYQPAQQNLSAIRNEMQS